MKSSASSISNWDGKVVRLLVARLIGGDEDVEAANFEASTNDLSKGSLIGLLGVIFGNIFSSSFGDFASPSPAKSESPPLQELFRFGERLGDPFVLMA